MVFKRCPRFKSGFSVLWQLRFSAIDYDDSKSYFIFLFVLYLLCFLVRCPALCFFIFRKQQLAAQQQQ